MPKTRLIRVSGDLLDLIGTRTEDGRTLTYEWGEPVDWVTEDGSRGKRVPVYEPTVTAIDDRETRKPALSLHRKLAR